MATNSTDSKHTHRLVTVIPGALGFQLEAPPGVPDFDTARIRQIRLAEESSSVSTLTEDERSAVFGSLARTAARAQYHHARLTELRKALDDRRTNLPGEVFWDTVVDCVHFELQAFCGAARMAIDEIVYIAARRNGVAPKKARRKPWESSDLIKQALPPACDVEETRVLRSHVKWFESLNAYRNSFFHHGWRHGTGHFACDDLRSAAREPAMNALLVPDRSSLRSRSKPFEWTYNDGTTIDDVRTEVAQGLDSVLSMICERAWGTAEPAPGTIPRHEQPNILVVLIVPAILQTPVGAIIPLFSTESLGRTFVPFCSAADVELVHLPVSRSVVDQPAISLSLKGLTRNSLPAGTRHIHLLLDPEPVDAQWTQLRAGAQATVDVEELFAAGLHHPVTLPVDNLNEIFVWREPFVTDWRS